MKNVIAKMYLFTLIFAGAAFCGEDGKFKYAAELSGNYKNKVELQIDPQIKSPEGYSISSAEGVTKVSGGTSAGILYGVQDLISNNVSESPLQSPDFELRGTALFLMKEGTYDYQLTEQEFPWFYDRALLTKYLDYLFANRFNTIFLWTGHLFPSIVEMPEYPDATDLSREELLKNQEQFKWFSGECAKRNISVLLHFYNIHITKPLAKSRNIPVHYTAPNEFVTKYISYSIDRFVSEFDSVGLYVCPGEMLESRYQVDWIKDVIIPAATKNGHTPKIVIRDWSLPAQKFIEAFGYKYYDNMYTELKHNVETLLSPVPDERHAVWMANPRTPPNVNLPKHIANVHELGDIKPFRWGSPTFIHEMVLEWKKIGLAGAEVYPTTSWRWPYSLDKLAPDQNSYWPKGPKLVSFERDAIWLEAFGRYLWKTDRNPEQERQYWISQLSAKFGNEKAGSLILEWYETTGPILPGLQNLTSVINFSSRPAAIGREQTVDAILSARKMPLGVPEADRLKEVPELLEHYPSMPVDSFFLERYKQEYKLPNITNRISMPVAQYASILAQGKEVNDAMTPDKITQLFVKMAMESQEKAKKAFNTATINREEVGRFITDSQALTFIAQAWQCKIMAAIYRRAYEVSKQPEYLSKFMNQMEGSILVYEKLVDLTDKTYIAPTDQRMLYTWHVGFDAFKIDLENARKFLDSEQQRENWKKGLY